MKILVSAGEASGDLYAAALVDALRERLPEAEFFGCTGPRLSTAGVRTIVDAARLNVVGLVEVIRHVPRIWGAFRKLVSAARSERPDLAVLTDSPDFHLRLAPKLTALGIPVVYLVAPQVWAWRGGRIKTMRRHIRRLLCIFPFEEDFFQDRGLPATYIGHPLTRIVEPRLTPPEFLAKHGLPANQPLIVLLPGSRPGEIARHLPILVEAARRIRAVREVSFVVATPHLTEPLALPYIQHVEGETWEAIAAAGLAVAASGTVTIEAAILGTPMVAFYKVSPLSWWMGRHLVNVPFLSMVNLVAGKQVVPELIQNDCTPDRLAAEVVRLLDPQVSFQQQLDLHAVVRRLASEEPPMERAAAIVANLLVKESADVGKV